MFDHVDQEKFAEQIAETNRRNSLLDAERTLRGATEGMSSLETRMDRLETQLTEARQDLAELSKVFARFAQQFHKP